MPATFKPDTLLQTVGSIVKNKDGEYLGKIMEVTRNKQNGSIEYLILKSKKVFGPGERNFAIPPASSFIDLDKHGMVIFKSSIDDLQFAQGVAAERCPPPTDSLSTKIYELYKYQVPD